MMFRTAYAFTVMIVLTLALAPLTLLTMSHNPTGTLADKTAVCFSPKPPVAFTNAVPATQPAKLAPAKAAPAKAPYSSARLAYVNQWTGNPARSAQILKAVHKVAAETGLTPALLLAVIKPESGFNHKASGRGYKGLMQVSVRHHRDRMKRLRITDVYDVEQNIRLGADIIIDYKKTAKGNLRKALVRYTGGSGKAADSILRDAKRIPS